MKPPGQLKRIELKRKTPLARSTKPLKRQYMPRTSTKSKVRKARAVQLYKDAHGLTFDDVNKLLRPVRDWPHVDDVDAEAVLDNFRYDCISPFGRLPCWLCGKERYLDCCHIVPRSDERCNLVAFCSCLPRYGYSDSCHDLTEKNWAMLKEVLKAKWDHDREHTDWMAIAIRRRQLFTFRTLD
jgi:hypothetical protein